MDDMELLHQWVAGGSEDAFRSLVDRHINLVYSSARRLMFNPHQAEEVTQTVFILLARKAGSLSGRTVLAGWLYRATGYAAAQLLRSESRRHQRQASLMNTDPTQADSVWEQMQPILEEAMTRLAQADRDAILLRFMEGKSLQEVGRAFGLSEEAARKRVHRAVEKLRAVFGRRGVITSACLFEAALATSATSAAPAGLASSIAAVAVGNGILLTASTSTLVKATLALMTWTHTKIAVVAAAVLLLAGATTVMISQRADSPARPPGLAAAAATTPVPAADNDEGRLGGLGNPQPDWPSALSQARSLREREQVQRIWCVDNLKQVGGAARAWAVAHDRVFPSDFFALKAQISSRYLTCPADGSRQQAGRWADTTVTNLSYDFISPGARLSVPNLVVVRCPVHGHAAMSDGSVLQGDIIAQRGLNPDNTLR